MPEALRQVLFAVALVTLVIVPLNVWHRQQQVSEIQARLVDSLGELTEEQVESCLNDGNANREWLDTHWYPIIDLYAWMLCAMGEPPLPHALPYEGIAMRLLVLPSFEPPYAIRVQSFPFGYHIHTAQLQEQFPSSAATRTEDTLSAEQWHELMSTFDRVGFWELPAPMPSMGLDGSTWVLEVATHDGYHAVERWSGGELEPVGALLREWSGLQIEWW